MLITLQRPAPPSAALPLFSPEAADRLARFTPPFQFTSFFSPEDTLLCVLAAERAVGVGVGSGSNRSTPTPDSHSHSSPHFVELTAGSGLVGLRLLELVPGATLVGADVDPAAPPVARRNAESLGMGDRARFAELSVLDPACDALLAERPIDVLVCNPPYVPEPPGLPLALEAGSGPDGAAHLRRVAELAARHRPRAVALSWCSLGDPVGVVGAMEAAGYALTSFDVLAIADGEYSGLVEPYLRTLPTAFLNAEPATREALAGDGAARFAYLLLAGVWSGSGEGGVKGPSAVPAVEALMRGFARRGLDALVAPELPCDHRAWMLDRWDELALRAMLHGPAEPPTPISHPA